MRVLVACEFSGVVRRAFRAVGHDAWSCDLLQADDGGEHYLMDVRKVLDRYQWDLMLAFPPCTHLAVSGARWWKTKPVQDLRDAEEFFMSLIQAPVPKIAVENPIGRMSTMYRKPDQIIQPWQFGHEETKATCLWLKDLPCLVPTQVMEIRNRNLTPSGQNKLGPSPDRWKLRSTTYSGIARAMADQWGR